jgi:hypothetical protein
MVSTDNTTLPEYILLSLEAKRRGYKSTLAFRRWCQNKRVPYITDGKKKWVRPADVDAAIRGLTTPEAVSLDAAATAGVASLFGSHGKAA